MGTLFVDEVAFDITAIWMDDGRVWFRGARRGPVEYPGSHWRVHAPDGSVVLVADVEVEWPKHSAADDGTTWVELPMRVEGSRPGEPWASSREDAT